MNQHHTTTTYLHSPGQRIISIDAILDVIFSFSTPRSIIVLSKTCRAARPIAASYLRVAYRPEHLLRHFLPDPAIVRAFRTLQAETGLIIFGKAAYNFLARAASLIDTVVDLYVDELHASAVNNFLTHDAGYDMEMREHELVFFRTEEDGQATHEIVLQVGPPDSYDSVDKPRSLPSEFADVITFDGAYSLFPAQYDEDPSGEHTAPTKPPLALAKITPMYRSFSDCASWVVTFEQTPTEPPQLAFGTSLPVRDPLFTSSLLVSPPQGRPIGRYRDIWLCGVMLRSRLLRLTHIMCCAELSQFVQQFLTRMVIAHPMRSKSYFDAEVAQFLRACLEIVDVRKGLASYSDVWAIMKELAPLPSDTPGAGGLQWPCKT